MRFLVFTLLHILSVLAVLSPMVLFAWPPTARQLPYFDEGLFLGLSIYWFFLPCLIGVLCGIFIDWFARKWKGENHYEKTKWSKTRMRVAVMTILGAAMLYLHFWLQSPG